MLGQTVGSQHAGKEGPSNTNSLRALASGNALATRCRSRQCTVFVMFWTILSHVISNSRRPPRRWVSLQLVAATAPMATAPPHPADAPSQVEARDQRLEVLVQLRKLYRNLLRAETLLQVPSPVYKPPPDGGEAGEAISTAAVTSQPTCTDNGTSIECSPAAEEEELRRLQEAVDVVAELQLTAEELKAGLRTLRAAPVRWGSVFDPSAGPTSDVEALITSRVRDTKDALVARAAVELPTLPFGSQLAAQAALDARNARYRLNQAEGGGSQGWPPAHEWHSGDESDVGSPDKSRGLGERLEAAERVAEAFVARKLQPAVARVRRTSPQGVVQGIKSSAVWARDLWTRLNGGSAAGARDAPQGLPLPTSSEEARKRRVAALNVEIEALEERLQEASKTRESRLRKAGIQVRRDWRVLLG